MVDNLNNNDENNKPILFIIEANSKFMLGQYDIDHDWLWKEYGEKGTSAYRIAKILGINSMTVGTILLRHRIPRQEPIKFRVSKERLEVGEKPEYKVPKPIVRILIRERDLPEYIQEEAEFAYEILHENGGYLPDRKWQELCGLDDETFQKVTMELKKQDRIE